MTELQPATTSLAVLEAVIEHMPPSFVELGGALRVIRDSGLYKRGITEPSVEYPRAAHYNAALVWDDSSAELVQCWPAPDAGMWWVKVTERPSGASLRTRCPVHTDQLAALLPRMGADPNALTSWYQTPAAPFTAWPVSPASVPPMRTPAASPQGRRVYFIQADATGPIKIGVARQPRARLMDLQTSTAVPLHGLGVVPGDLSEEAALHAQFSELRLRGEWFMPGPALLDYIREEAQPWPTR